MVAKREAVIGDLGPTLLDLKGVRAGDKNEVIARLKVYGVPFDLTDYTLEASARVKTTDTGDAPIIAECLVVDDPTGGVVSIKWPGDQIRTVLAGNPEWNGVWDFQVTKAPERPITLLEGKFNAVQDVTR